MAIKDVKQYYYNMQAQYLELKDCLQDFEQAFRDGNITEDQLTNIVDDINKLEVNYERLSYVMYLLELPNRANKRNRRLENDKLTKYFADRSCDAASVCAESDSVLTHIRGELAKLVKAGGQIANE